MRAFFLGSLVRTNGLLWLRRAWGASTRKGGHGCCGKAGVGARTYRLIGSCVLLVIATLYEVELIPNEYLPVSSKLL